MKKTFIIGALVLATTACTDNFINLEPVTSQTPENFYQTEEDALLALAAAYNDLQTQNWQFPPIMGDIFSDDAYAGGASAGDMKQWQAIELNNMDLDNEATNALWANRYAGINKVNTFLSRIDNMEVSEGKKNQFVGEAYFLRAYFNWDLVRHYGWAILHTELLDNVDDYALTGLSEPQAIYNQIAADLLQAESLMQASHPDADFGRANKFVAQALMARIYLYYSGLSQNMPEMGLNGTFGEGENVITEAHVIEGLNNIIFAGGYRLLPSYADVFAWDNELNDEVIFSYKYSGKTGVTDWDGWAINGNFSVIFYGPRNPEGDDAIRPGWSFGTVSWDLVDSYQTGDLRRDVVAYDAEANLTDYFRAFQNTGYFNRKYMPNADYEAEIGDPAHNYGIDYKDIRYADVLLMAAELGIDRDENYNRVKRRAYGYDPDFASPVDETGVTVEDIIEERRREFGGEGLRKWDLLRNGLAYTQQKIANSFQLPAGIPNAADFQGREFNPNTYGLFPLPGNEIRNSNAGITQQVPAYQ